MSVLVADPDGFPFIVVSDDYAARAIERGEVVATERPDLVAINPQPLCSLTGAQRRRHYLRRNR